jgi:hypothetical protein
VVIKGGFASKVSPTLVMNNVEDITQRTYQLGWTTLPGLLGLSVSEFRATPTEVPDNQRGVAVEFANKAGCEEFLRQIEAAFESRRFTNAADAFDTVKAFVLEHAPNR